MGVFWGNTLRGVYHPPREQTGPLTREALEECFGGCADLVRREVKTRSGALCVLYWLDGMVKSERVSDALIRPLMAAQEAEPEALLQGAVWNLSAQRRDTLAQVAEDVTGGMAAVFLPQGVLTCSVETEAKRPVSAVENEVSEKGARDAFVESLQTNTGLIRRRLRTPELRLKAFSVGRESRTAVDVVWVEGLTDPALVQAVEEHLQAVDIDALLSTEDLEAHLLPGVHGAFPNILFTERPDRFCRAVLEGRVGLLTEGIPLGAILPGDLALFLQAPQDSAYHWTMTAALLVLRYLCLMMTLTLPGFYVSVASYHLEMLPTKLAASIIASKQDVPFSTVFEVLVLLLAFEILQEAGLRLPKTIGQTVSIIGGLVVGQAAVEAKIVSPAVVIVVAAAGIAGFTAPNQDLANALRLWRFALTVLAGAAGFFGLTAGLGALVGHLAGLECLGVAYLSPFAPAAGALRQEGAVLGQPLSVRKLRTLALRPGNRRKQK